MNKFILSSKRIKITHSRKIYYVPQHVLMCGYKEIKLYNLINSKNLENSKKTQKNLMSGAFGVILIYKLVFSNDMIIAKIMIGNSKKIQNEINFYNIMKMEDNYNKYICKYYGHFKEKYKGKKYKYLFLEKLEMDLYDYLYNEWDNHNLVGCIKLLKNICKNLIFVHSHKNGFVYNDLKLENLMIDNNGDVKLIDFNCVACEKLGWEGSGTLEYMSPEMISSLKNHEVMIDKKSDAWSFGLIIYELFTKLHSPFMSGKKRHILKNISKNKYNDCDEAKKLFKLNCLLDPNESILDIFSGCLKTSCDERLSIDEALEMLNKIKI